MISTGIATSTALKYTSAFVAIFRIIPQYIGNGDGLITSFINVLIATRWLQNSIRYYLTFGRFPNYLNPTTMSEKMQWRKIFDRNPAWPIFCDKLGARKYATDRAPELRFAKTYWSGDKPDEMPLDAIAPPYVIKPNHRSRAIMFVRRPEDIDRPRIVQTCRKWLGGGAPGRKAGEWGYSQVDRKILIEEFLSDGAKITPPPDYKFFVYGGRVRYIYFSRGRYSDGGRALGLYSPTWEKMPLDKWRRGELVRLDGTVPEPKNLRAMIEVAEKVGAEVDHVRVDLYNLDGVVYFGELTAYANSGIYMWVAQDAEFRGRPPRDLDDEFGTTWNLPHIPYWTRVRGGLFG